MPIYVLRKLQLVSCSYRVGCKKHFFYYYFLLLLSLTGKQSLFLKSAQREREMYPNLMIIASVNSFCLLLINVLETGHVSRIIVLEKF